MVGLTDDQWILLHCKHRKSVYKEWFIRFHLNPPIPRLIIDFWRNMIRDGSRIVRTATSSGYEQLKPWPTRPRCLRADAQIQTSVPWKVRQETQHFHHTEQLSFHITHWQQVSVELQTLRLQTAFPPYSCQSIWDTRADRAPSCKQRHKRYAHNRRVRHKRKSSHSNGGPIH